MKHLFLISIIILTSIFGLAQTNDLVVFSEKGEEFTLYVNSVKQNDNPLANVKVKDINGENFIVRIKFDTNTIPEITQNFWTESKNVMISAVIVQNKKGKYVLRYMGESPKSDNESSVKEGPYISNKVQTENEPEVQESSNSNVVITMDVKGNSESSNDNNKGETVALNMNVNVDGESMNVTAKIDNDNVTYNETTTTVVTTTNFNSNTVENEDNTVSNTETYSRCTYAMSIDDFNDAKSSITSKSFEDTKLTTAKQICKNSCMTADQIRDINKLFSFEETRIDFAKYAYDYVFDSSKYYKVNDSFSFESSIEQLNEYIESK